MKKMMQPMTDLNDEIETPAQPLKKAPAPVVSSPTSSA